MKHPLTRLERIVISKLRAGRDYAKTWLWKVRQHHYIGYGWYSDSAKKDYMEDRNDRFMMWIDDDGLHIEPVDEPAKTPTNEGECVDGQ